MAKQNLMLVVRNAATRRLIEENNSRFEELMVEEATKHGVEYVPEPTPEQKREAALKALLEEDPTLLQRVGYEPVQPALADDVDSRRADDGI